MILWRTHSQWISILKRLVRNKLGIREGDLFMVYFTSGDPDLFSTTSPPTSSSITPSQPPVAETSIDIDLQPPNKPSTTLSPSTLQTSGVSGINTPKLWSAQARHLKAAIQTFSSPTPGTGFNSPDQLWHFWIVSNTEAYFMGEE